MHAALFGLTQKIVDGIGQLAELNMQFIRTALADTADQAQQALSVREPHEWLALQGSLAAPMADKTQAYSRQVIDIVSATQAECVRFARAQYEAYGHGVQSLVRDVAKNAPAGSEAALDSAITATNALVETLQRTGEQAVEATRSNLDLAAAAAAKSAKRAAEPLSHAAKR
ncbi:phasin family protein [Paraburkholderia fungorum]|uniref:phasin family protein n=1 Tax=Paraburkholderia fungorum TaxID=134537 RepID=UPI0020A70801|nr:phasin family protein [Paraburkholderia fungorum]